MEQAAVEKFLYHEANLLDDRDFESWIALFADDGLYWVPSNSADRDPNQRVSIFYENVEGLKDRVWCLGPGMGFAQ